jgi:hypothetical protein
MKKANKKGECKKEKEGWLLIAQKSLSKIWDNKKDNETWAVD